MILLVSFKNIVNLITFFIILASIYIYTVLNYGEKDKNPLIFVSVISGRENFENRQEIRGTWGKWTKTTEADLKFVVGKECSVPPNDRVFDQSCTGMSWLHGENYDSTFWSNTFTSSLPTQQTLSGFAFLVNFPIVLNSVKLARSGQTGGQTVVTVINAHTQEQLDSLQFSSFIQDEAELKTLPYLLPRGFEGIVKIQGEFKAEKIGCHRWIDHGNFIKPTWLIGNDSTLPIESEGNCVPVAFSFQFSGAGKFVKERKERLYQWKERLKTVSRNLAEENENHKDILFVETVDVYRNLTSKMLDVYQWASNHRSNSFLLKVDDDTFVDFEKIESYIKENDVEVRDKAWWWAALKTHWAVARYGKWRDNVYLSLSYPPFPCGAAYVISPFLVSVLGQNASFLTKYPFEDTALGLWCDAANLSPILGRSDECEMDCGVRENNCNKASCFISQCKLGDMARLMSEHERRGFVC